MSDSQNTNAVLEAAESAAPPAEEKGFFAKLRERFTGTNEGESDAPAEGRGVGSSPEPSKAHQATQSAAEEIRDEFEAILERMDTDLKGDGFDPADLLKALNAMNKRVKALSESNLDAKQSAEEIKQAHIGATAKQIQSTATSVAKRMSELVGEEVDFKAVLDAWVDLRPVIQKRYDDIDQISAGAFEFAFKKLYADEIAEATKAKAKSSPTLSKSSAPVSGAKSLEQAVLDAYRSAK